LARAISSRARPEGSLTPWLSVPLSVSVGLDAGWFAPLIVREILARIVAKSCHKFHEDHVEESGH
jgi:hypothetical protein